MNWPDDYIILGANLYHQEEAGLIYLGDCRDILPHLPKVDLVLTDPFYGHGENTDYAKRKRGNKIMKGTLTKSKNWGIDEKDYPVFDPGILTHFPKIILWGANHYASRLPDASKWLVWDKRENVSSDDNADCELAWTNLKGVARIHRQLWKGICRKGEENIAISGSKLHPFQKPIDLMKWCILQADPVEIIADFYFGSGTTLCAAKELGRKFIGIEISEEYCRIAVKRLRQGVLNF